MCDNTEQLSRHIAEGLDVVTEAGTAHPSSSGWLMKLIAHPARRNPTLRRQHLPEPPTAILMTRWGNRGAA